MKPNHFSAPPAGLWRVALLGLICMIALAARAHGPDGDHEDKPLQAGAPGLAQPRLETHSEQFELLAWRDGAQLIVLIDRFESNEPVLGAQVEVEFDGLKAKASYREASGDYLIDDAPLLLRLNTPGAHGLVFTVVAGKDADLLDGSLAASAEQAGNLDHHHDDPVGLSKGRLVALALLALVLLGGALRWRATVRQKHNQGVQA
jgi:hypothetical protein